MVWKKASEQLPWKSGDVVVVTTHKTVTTVSYSDRHKKFNAHDSNNGKNAISNVVYWAYPEDILPEGFRV